MWPPLPDRPPAQRAAAPVPTGGGGRPLATLRPAIRNGGSVVAHPVVVHSGVVVARPVVVRATTEPTGTKPATTGQTGKPELPWRIEINRRARSGGGHSYHWLYRFGRGKNRRAVYGGTIDRLIAMNPERWSMYRNNTGDKI